MDLEMKFSTVTWAIVGLAFLVLLVTIGLNYYLKSQAQKDLTGKYQGKKWKSPLDEHGQYPDVDAFRFSGPLTKFGAAFALATVLFAFSATSYDQVIDIPDGALDLEEEIEVEPPRTAETTTAAAATTATGD